jgi:hypothetical protein
MEELRGKRVAVFGEEFWGERQKEKERRGTLWLELWLYFFDLPLRL